MVFMWYLLIVGIAALTFFFSPWEPLLQASNRERVPYKDLKFPLYTRFRVSMTLFGAVASLVFYHLVEGPAFLVTLVLPLGAVYTHDFLKALKIARRHRQG
jgi:hypothetical protein